MPSFLFIILAYLTGFIAAIPAGPVQIEVIRRSVNGHIRSAFTVIIGALIADIFYGVIAFFGIAPYLKGETVMAYFSLAGAGIISLLGIMIILNSRKNQSTGNNSRYLRKKRWGFVGGFSLSITNPMMILWWLIGAKLFIDIKIIDNFTSDIAVSFLAAGGSGFVTYLIALSLFIHWAKRFISDGKIRQINIITGFIMIVIAGYFLYSSLHRL